MPSDSSWSDWKPVPGAPALTPATLAELIDGGQAFRWQTRPDRTWLGIWSDCIVSLRLGPTGVLHWSAPAPLTARVSTELPSYLFGHDTRAALDTLPWRSDPHLARCLAAFPGLTILRQPFGETLLGFLCSATKQIVQIKQMISLLAERHGTPLSREKISPPPDPVCHLISDKLNRAFDSKTGAVPRNRLPDWEELAAISETDLRACLLGFRARYIHQTSQFPRRAPRLA